MQRQSKRPAAYSIILETTPEPKRRQRRRVQDAAAAPAPAQTASSEPKKDAFSQFIAASQQVQQVQEAPVPSAETPAPASEIDKSIDALVIS